LKGVFFKIVETVFEKPLHTRQIGGLQGDTFLVGKRGSA
jgi:hypothetical protein